ncbi:hypothetical protein GJ496_002023 [Pomphorhynchus laevis]|nr:hypothetical protein GJ496_002023 [Pomphorhynchus laevis]
MPRRSAGGSRRSASPNPIFVQKRSQYGQAKQPAKTNSTGSFVQTPQSPGLFGQMAATAAGVAVGSTVGRVAAGSLLGDRSEGTPVAQSSPQTELSANPCYDSINNFLRCIEENNDVSMCQGFSEVLKECKARHGLQ